MDFDFEWKLGSHSAVRLVREIMQILLTLLASVAIILFIAYFILVQSYLNDLTYSIHDLHLYNHRKFSLVGEPSYYKPISPSLSVEDLFEGNSTKEGQRTFNVDFIWTDTKLKNILDQGCQKLLTLYEPNLAHKKGYPIGYSLLVQQNASEVERLIRSVYRPYYEFSIHVDNKPTSADTFDTLQTYAQCFRNIHLVEDRVNIHYAGYSRLEADLRCMKQLLKFGGWKHLINLCGRDFPIRSNDQIEYYLAQLGDSSDISSHETKPDDMKYRRIATSQYQAKELTRQKGLALLAKGYYLKRYGWAGVWAVSDAVDKIETYPYGPNATLYNGMAYNIYARNFLQWALYDDEQSKKLFQWSIDTYSPDEHVWAILIRASGQGSNISKFLSNFPMYEPEKVHLVG